MTTTTAKDGATTEAQPATDRLKPLRDRLDAVGAMLQWEAKPRGVPFRLECWISRARHVYLIQVWNRDHDWNVYGELDATNNAAAALGKIV